LIGGFGDEKNLRNIAAPAEASSSDGHIGVPILGAVFTFRYARRQTEIQEP